MKMIAKMMLPLLALSCQPSQQSHLQNEKLATEMFEAFNRHDWSAMAGYYAEDALFLDPSFGTSYVKKSRGETAEKYAGMQKLFPDIHDEIVGMYASGDHVTVEFTSTGSSSDGAKFTLPIATVLTFKDGLIIKDATYYDNP